MDMNINVTIEIENFVKLKPILNVYMIKAMLPVTSKHVCNIGNVFFMSCLEFCLICGKFLMKDMAILTTDKKLVSASTVKSFIKQANINTNIITTVRKTILK